MHECAMDACILGILLSSSIYVRSYCHINTSMCYLIEQLTRAYVCHYIGESLVFNTRQLQALSLFYECILILVVCCFVFRMVWERIHRLSHSFEGRIGTFHHLNFLHYSKRLTIDIRQLLFSGWKLCSLTRPSSHILKS